MGSSVRVLGCCMGCCGVWCGGVVCGVPRLPDDVAVTTCVEVPHTFHPQEHVERKLYSYTVVHRRRRALGRRQAWFCGTAPLDLARMAVAARALEGTHDFSSFSHITRGSGKAARVAAAKWHAKGYSHARSSVGVAVAQDAGAAAVTSRDVASEVNDGAAVSPAAARGAQCDSASPRAVSGSALGDVTATAGPGSRTVDGDSSSSSSSGIERTDGPSSPSSVDVRSVDAGGDGVVDDEAAYEPADNVRTMHRVEVRPLDDSTVVIELEASSFTRGMARNIVGCLVAVGQGRSGEDCVPRVLAACDRAAAGDGAPAHGLCLEWIRYKADPAQ